MTIYTDAKNVINDFITIGKKLHMDKLFTSFGRSLKGSMKRKAHDTGQSYDKLCNWLKRELRK